MRQEPARRRCAQGVGTPAPAGQRLGLGGHRGAVALALVLGIVGWRLTRGIEEYGATMVGPPTPTNATDSIVPVPVTDGRPPATTPVPPVRLEIPAIGVAASVKPVGIDQETGEVEVPRSVDTVGWYQFGPDLGSAGGSVVIAGHVDSAEQGKGAFPPAGAGRGSASAGYRLRRAGPDVHRTVARGVREGGGAARPALCPRWRPATHAGHLWWVVDAATRHHRDNIVLTASPS